MTCYTYLPYTLTLNSSVILTIPGGEPNSSSTLSYISGTVVRGAIAAKLGDPDSNPSVKQEFNALVLGEKICYLNAYPMAKNIRSLPTPVSMRKEKSALADTTVNAQDLAAYSGDNSTDQDSWPTGQLIPIPENFLSIGGPDPTLVQPKLSSRIHQQRDRQKGRAWKDQNGKTHGAIFTFESLDANQTFEGLMQLQGETEQELLQIENRITELLKGAQLFGRSRRATYGGMASIVTGKSRSREISGSGREGLRPLFRAVVQHEQFRVLLTSPCIVRNLKTGQVDPAALEDAFLRLFDNRVEIVRKRWSFDVIGGFNRKWRMEVPQAMVVSAGSVFVVKAKQNISCDDLLLLEHQGVGERKSEGYGRFLFLDMPLPNITLHQQKDTPSVTEITGEPPKLVVAIESRILQAQLNKRIEEKAAAIAKKAMDPLPSNSLIGRLRNPLRSCDYAMAVDTLRLWLGDNEASKLKQPALDQLERCKIESGTNLRTWLQNALNAESLSSLLDLDSLLRQSSLGSDLLRQSRKIEKPNALSIRLIDAVLAALAIRNKVTEASDGQ